MQFKIIIYTNYILDVLVNLYYVNENYKDMMRKIIEGKRVETKR